MVKVYSFAILKNIWSSRMIRNKTKIMIFNSNVKAVLLYGAETWRTTKGNTKKLQTFINRCVRRILHLRWYDRTPNSELWDRAWQRQVEQEIRSRRWRWIGHTLRKPPDSITRQALRWNPQGNRVRGRPSNTWRRELETECKKMGREWRDLERMALVADLCFPRGEG